MTFHLFFSLDYKVTINIPSSGNRAVSEGRFSMKIGDRVIDLPMTNTTIRAGQPLQRRLTTTAIRPTNAMKLRWTSILRNSNDAMTLLVNSVKIEGVTGSQIYCGLTNPQQLNHTVWHDFSTTTCVKK